MTQSDIQRLLKTKPKRHQGIKTLVFIGAFFVFLATGFLGTLLVSKIDKWSFKSPGNSISSSYHGLKQSLCSKISKRIPEKAHALVFAPMIMGVSVLFGLMTYISLKSILKPRMLMIDDPYYFIARNGVNSPPTDDLSEIFRVAMNPPKLLLKDLREHGCNLIHPGMNMLPINEMPSEREAMEMAFEMMS